MENKIEYMKQWRLKNPEKIKVHQHNNYIKNKDKIKKSSIVYYYKKQKLMAESKCSIKKICTKCLEEKPLFNFYSNIARKDGKDNFCIICKKDKLYKYYHANRNRIINQRKDSSRRCAWKRQGIKFSLEEYNEMFSKQGGCCRICNVHQSKMKNGLAVDHCHDTGKVRGLLCLNCNIGIGNFKHNIEFLTKAISYLYGDI